MPPIGPIGTAAERVAAVTLGIAPIDVSSTTPSATDRNQRESGPVICRRDHRRP